MSNMTDLWLSRVFFQALNIPKLVFCSGSAPDPGGEFTTLLQTSYIVSWGGGVPIRCRPRRLRRLDLGAFGASLVS